MKIVQVLTRGDVVGGAQSHVYDLCKALRHAGHEVMVITGQRGIFNERLAECDVPQESISCLVRPVDPRRDFLALIALVRAFRRLKPDLVCAHTAKAGWLARVAARIVGIPSTFTPHGWSVIDRGSLKVKSFYLWAERLAAAFGTRIINVCHFEKELAAGFQVASPDTLDVVHNGVADLPLARIEPVSLDPPRIVMVARYEEQKDHVTLLHALAGLQDLPWRLTLVGEGALEHVVRNIIQLLNLNKRVELLSGNSDIDQVLLASQIFVLSTKFEAFPISILEAMRAQIPVVATNVGGIAEAVADGETGLLVSAGDIDSLREALRRLVTDPGLRVRMGACGRLRFLSSFTSETMAAHTIRVYQRACPASSTQAAVPETA